MIIAFIVVVLLTIYIYKTTSKPARLPPGSFGLPVYGSIPPRNVPITEHFRNLKKKYGNIFTTKWGSRVIIVLGDINWIKKGMNHPSLQGRGYISYMKLLGYDLNLGVVHSIGKVWSDNRRFLLRYLRDLGMGKSRLEKSIQEEAQMLIEYLEETSMNKPSEIDWGINVAVVNVLWQMLAGKRYRADDEEIVENIKIVSEGMQIMQGPLAIIRFMPWISKILPDVVTNVVTKKHVMERNRDYFFQHCRKIIKEHEASLDPDNPRDVIDYYLLEIEANKADPESTFKPDHMDLISCMGDMFGAGSETSSSTLRWIILYMAIRPEIQSKVQSAIDAVVPWDRLPSLDDRPKLAYLDAMILDVMRLSSIFENSLPHSATESVMLGEYFIPKDAIVLPCLQLCHRDATFWERPDDLYPEHFLDDNGKLDSKKELLMPFGIGRRKCLGESLARMQLFFFASAILQRFTIEAPPGTKLFAESCPNEQFLNIPKPFKVVLKKRV